MFPMRCWMHCCNLHCCIHCHRKHGKLHHHHIYLVQPSTSNHARKDPQVPLVVRWSNDRQECEVDKQLELPWRCLSSSSWLDQCRCGSLNVCEGRDLDCSHLQRMFDMFLSRLRRFLWLQQEFDWRNHVERAHLKFVRKNGIEGASSDLNSSFISKLTFVHVWKACIIVVSPNAPR